MLKRFIGGCRTEDNIEELKKDIKYLQNEKT